MLRSPSARALSNTVDLYRFTGTQDADGGVAASPYGVAIATSVPCSVQPNDPIRLVDKTTMRIVERTPYDVYFATNYLLQADDKIVWTDDAGTVRTLVVMGSANQAGQGGAFVVSAQENQ
jgi:hypothetical protein